MIYRLGNNEDLIVTNGTDSVGVLSLSETVGELGTPNEIESITATESQVSGGNNVVTVTDTDGNVTSFNVKNGGSAYQVYYSTTSDNPKKTEAQWLESLKGADGVDLGEVGIQKTNQYKPISCVFHLSGDTMYNKKFYDDQTNSFITIYTDRNCTAEYTNHTLTKTPQRIIRTEIGNYGGLPNYPGEMAISVGKVYIGMPDYTWKQISNS